MRHILCVTFCASHGIFNEAASLWSLDGGGLPTSVQPKFAFLLLMPTDYDPGYVNKLIMHKREAFIVFQMITVHVCDK